MPQRLRRCVACLTILLPPVMAGCSDGTRTPTFSSASGTWLNEVDLGGGNKRATRLTFHKGREISWDITLSRNEIDARLYVRLQYDELGDGTVSVTMISKRSGGENGEEVIQPEDRAPREWTYEFEGEDVLRITRPNEILGPAESTLREYVFRREGAE